jgi:hypothetical protein
LGGWGGALPPGRAKKISGFLEARKWLPQGKNEEKREKMKK